MDRTNLITALGTCLLLSIGLGIPRAAHAAPENTGTSQLQLGIDRTVGLWTAPNNTIPVCWATPGFAREKGIVQRAVRDTWEYYADVNFAGWGDCPASGDAPQVRIAIQNQGIANAGAGGSAQRGTLALSKPGGPANVNFSFNPDGSANAQRVEYIGVHEMGHVLGFVHEMDLPGNPPEAPAHCYTIGIDPKADSITPYDRDSIMNYCNVDGNGQGRLTDIDILGVRSVYGPRTHFAPSAVVLLGDGQMWRFMGRRCSDTACPGWQLIDKDARIKSIATSDSKLFARQGTGQIWVWDGHTACSNTACPGWTLIDGSTKSSQIVASGNTLYQLQVDGKIWQWDGRTVCTTAGCPGWALIDSDSRITSIAASDSKLFARQSTGQVWTWDGRSRCSNIACPGWSLIDANTRSTQIAAVGTQVFQLQVDGKLWLWDGRTVCTTAACPGWSLVDNDARIKTIAATNNKLFARQGTGELWVWDGRSRCTATACPGWMQIDSNPRSRLIAASGDTLFQLHGGGDLWRWDGKTPCGGGACRGWTLIDRDAQIVDLRAFAPVSEPSRLSAGTLF
ncbi:MAG TPA: hypothetical protein VGO61_02985 [Steroidobacteraceae bacterium]|nr:hypothetical protein [Steroidobacteraceae bacterium]